MEWRRVSSGTEHDLRRGRRLVRDRAARARVRARSGEGGRLVRRRVAAAGSAGQRQGWLTAFDADNGAVRWKFAASRPVLAGLTPTAGGVVFAADLGGTLYAFDAATGAVLWRLTTGPVDGRRDRELPRRREAADRRGGGDEVADLAGWVQREPDRGVRAAVAVSASRGCRECNTAGHLDASDLAVRHLPIGSAQFLSARRIAPSGVPPPGASTATAVRT